MSSVGSVGGRVQPMTSDNCNTNVVKMSLTSSTLKRNPKMELSRSDLLRLLSILEGELQAREIVIAVLKAEQIKKLLYPNKCAPNHTFSSKTIKMNSSVSESSTFLTYSDPWNALSRDAFGAYDPSFDKTTTIALFNMKMSQLEALIVQQRKARNNLRDELRITETKYNTLVAELELEKRLKIEDKSNDKQESDAFGDSVDNKLENDVKKMAQTLEHERCREKQIVLCLLSERKQLIIKLIEERQRNEELLQLLSTEKGKIAEMVEGLEDESKRSLQMEAELEKYLSDFEGEREKFRNQLSASETRNAELAAEVDRLREELDLSLKNEKGVNVLNLGEGVRSAIVTMSSSTRVVPTVPSVSTVSHPRASVAQPVSPKPLTNANSAHSQVSAKTAANAKVSTASPQGLQHSYATVQPISSVKMNATIPPPPSIPAPPPKALISNKSTANPHSQQTVVNPNAFQNMTYSLEPTTTITSTTATTESNHSTNSVNQTTTTGTSAAAKVMVEVSQTATTQSTQLQSPHFPIQRKLSASGAVGRGTPPPIPPNKPSKIVLPPQALQQRSKEVISAKVMSGPVGTPAKIVSGSIGNTMNSTANASTPSNNIKNTTIAASDSTGEQNNCQPINCIIGNSRNESNSNNSHNNDHNTDNNTDNTNNVDLLCQELENFNSLLVSMVSTGSHKNS